MSGWALVIGIGNQDRGDDAVGLHVARHLAARAASEGWAGVAVLEAAGDALALMEGWAGAARVVLVDAAAPGTAPGRIHRLDPMLVPLPREIALGSTHAFGLAETVELARVLGRLPERLVIYAIEAGGFEAGAALSPEVAASVAPVVARIAAELAGSEGGEGGEDA